MAGSRLERIGTIYSRASGLLKSGAVSWEDRPLWYDIYEAFPPKEEPRYDRPIPKLALRKIFYEEDKIRAVFHKHTKRPGIVNMLDGKSTTLTQRFIETYSKLVAQYKEPVSPEQLYQETIDLMKRERELKADDVEHLKSLPPKPQEPVLNVKISDVFK